MLVDFHCHWPPVVSTHTGVHFHFVCVCVYIYIYIYNDHFCFESCTTKLWPEFRCSTSGCRKWMKHFDEIHSACTAEQRGHFSLPVSSSGPAFSKLMPQDLQNEPTGSHMGRRSYFLRVISLSFGLGLWANILKTSSISWRGKLDPFGDAGSSAHLWRNWTMSKEFH